ncbi:MAG: tetratricopeptide repeat protein [Cytophagales bacterium]|nr:tetratricopeptide repeat protein [Bernardetiaceae bacterium]MDW8203545.1 tetratricopeptide repeat protein [Cytophagales bacterium]
MHLKQTICRLLLMGICLQASAQTTLYFTQPGLLFNKGIELYERGHYASARQQFEAYIRLNLQDERQVEAEYYALMCAMKEQSPDFNLMLENFVRNHSTHQMARNVYRTIGLQYYDQGIYTEAYQHLERVYRPSGKSEEEAEIAFKLAYSYFAEQKYQLAQGIFNRLKSGNSSYAPAASYYAGYIAFQEKRYEEALNDLGRATADSRYENEANSLIFSIYYLRREYNRAVGFAEQLERQGKSVLPQLEAPLADSYYAINRCDRALPLLETIVSKQNTNRAMHYRLAHCYALNKQPQKAIQAFSKVAEGSDSLAQMAAYQMALNYIDLKQLQLAANALKRARELTLDRRLRELSAYNLVKVSFELKNFGEAIEQATFYEQQFPQGEYIEEISYLKSEAYINGGNYAGALRYIEQLRNPNPRLQAAYQQIAFNYAAVLYNEEKFAQAVAALHKSLRRPVNPDLTHAAHFWLGESLVRQEKLDSAAIAYNRVPATAKEFPDAVYARAYLAFNQEDYPQAEQLFRQFLNLNIRKNRADVQTRIGDCRYIARDFNGAIILYNQALSEASADTDYIYYQIAQSYVGLQRPDEAIGLLDRLIANRNSRMAAAAAFLKATLQYEANRKDLAVSTYSQLINEHPNSELIPDALLKRGLAQSILGQNSAAIADYKAILDRFPTHPVASEAIQSLQELDARGEQISDLERYLQTFSRNNPNSEAAIQVAFNRARAPYDNGNYTLAVRTLNDFISSYPASRFSDEARFMLAFSMDEIGEKRNAIRQYSLVQGSNALRAGLRAAELELELGEVQAAFNRYSSLLSQATDNRNLARVMAGLIRTSFQLGQLNQAENFCKEVIARNLTVGGARGVAELHLGKIMLERAQFEQALTQFRQVANSYTDANGAEAQFRLGETLRLQKNYNASTNELIQVRNRFDHHPEWVYEAFLLIAENYIDLNNLFQARATLNSIVANATDEAVKQRALKRLNQLQ